MKIRNIFLIIVFINIAKKRPFLSRLCNICLSDHSANKNFPLLLPGKTVYPFPWCKGGLSSIAGKFECDSFSQKSIWEVIKIVRIIECKNL